MNKTILLLILLSTTASAEINFTLTPATGQPGQTITVNLNLQNDLPIWGFTAKITENSSITFATATATTRLQEGISGVSQNTPDKITAYSAFAGNTQGITPGTGTLFTIEYTIPEGITAGQYPLQITETTASDSQGQTIPATGTGTTITVTQPETTLKLPRIRQSIHNPVDVDICLINTYADRPVRSTNMVITHNPAIVQANRVHINLGTGNYDINGDEVSITINELNITSENCVNIATVRYTPLKSGTSPLIFQSATARDPASQPFSIQPSDNQNGEITLDSCQENEDCNDGNACTSDACIQGECVYTAIQGCGTTGGGGGGASTQYYTGCKTCAYSKYTCCGSSIEQINRFCEKPEAYSNYCKTEETTAPLLPEMMFQTEPEYEEEPAEEKLEEEKPAEEKPAPTEQAVQETKPKEPADLGRGLVYMFALILFFGSIFTAYITMKGMPGWMKKKPPEPKIKESQAAPVKSAIPEKSETNASPEDIKIINYLERKLNSKEQ